MTRMSIVKRILNKIKLYKYREAISGNSIEQIFSTIYNKKLWYSNKESTSGAGSTIVATETIRNELPVILRNLRCGVLLDIGCGDFNWMKEVDLSCRYIGVDIVRNVIERNSKTFGNEKISFLHLDAVSESIPKDCDVVLCREVLFHLSFKDSAKLISNVLDSGARYFITTTNDLIVENKDIRTGDFRNINLRLPPYNFPAYSDKIVDDKVSKNRILGVWRVNDIQQRVSNTI